MQSSELAIGLDDGAQDVSPGAGRGKVCIQNALTTHQLSRYNVSANADALNLSNFLEDILTVRRLLVGCRAAPIEPDVFDDRHEYGITPTTTEIFGTDL